MNWLSCACCGTKQSSAKKTREKSSAEYSRKRDWAETTQLSEQPDSYCSTQGGSHTQKTSLHPDFGEGIYICSPFRREVLDVDIASLEGTPNHDLPLYTVLSDSERQQLTASLQQETSDMQKKFQELVTNTTVELERCQVPLEILIQNIISQKDAFNHATSIQDVLVIAGTEGYWCFFNYDVLGQMIRQLNVNNSLLHKYDSHFRDYCKRRLRRLPSDGAAAEEKVVMLLDSKMGLQKTDVLKLTWLKMKASSTTGFTVTKLIWLEDDCPEPTLRTQHKDEGGDEEDTCSAKELDTAPTLRPPGEPHPPPQRYFMHSSKDKKH